MRVKRIMGPTLGLAGVLGAVTPAGAAGFALLEGATDWMANGFAGETAKSDDASTVFSNPAGMVRLQQSEIDASLNGILPTAHFAGADQLGGQPIAGSSGGNIAQAAATVGGFGVLNVSPDFKLGLAISEPFGLRTAYPADFVGRYQALVSSITDVNISLAGAWRITDRLSIGGGPVFDTLQARLTQALNLGPLGDGISNLHGGDVAAGFSLGVLYEVSPATRIGVTYRSRLDHDIGVSDAIGATGPAAVNPLASRAIAALSATGQTKLTLPDSVSLGAYHQIDPRWAVMADARWTDWSVLHNLVFTPDNGAPAEVIPEHWHNTGFASLGGSYRARSFLTLQGGVFYDESPVTDANRTARLPDSDRYGFGVGITWAVLRNIDLQAAYSHFFLVGGSIAESAAPTAGTLVGGYKTSNDSASLGVRVRF
jgi:long-chain fatty acid transport protein